MTSSISNKYRNDSNKCPGRLLNISIIEDEFNFLMICSTYESKRKIIPDTIYGSFPNVKVLDAKEQFIWLMSQEDVACTQEIAKFNAQCMKLREQELDILLIKG